MGSALGSYSRLSQTAAAWQSKGALARKDPVSREELKVAGWDKYVQGVKVAVEVSLELRSEAQHQWSEVVTGMNKIIIAKAKKNDPACRQHRTPWVDIALQTNILTKTQRSGWIWGNCQLSLRRCLVISYILMYVFFKKMCSEFWYFLQYVLIQLNLNLF